VDGATWWDLMTNDTLQAQQLTQWRDDATGLWTYINEAVGALCLVSLLSHTNKSI
jgi:hypothetical protein